VPSAEHSLELDAKPSLPPGRAYVAAPWHTATVLIALGYFSFRFALTKGNSGAALTSTASSRAAQLWHYAFLIASELTLALWVWAGIHWQGGHLQEIVGRRWRSWKCVALDFGIALPFWLIWEATAWGVHRLVDPLHAPTSEYHVPSGFLEGSLWIFLSLTAGFCEEFVYRGYLQRQFQAATGSVIAAVALQGLVFGLGHTYQGWGQVIVISALGMLYGALVAWRGNLRASMMAHAWSDIFEGYVKFL